MKMKFKIENEKLRGEWLVRIFKMKIFYVPRG